VAKIALTEKTELARTRNGEGEVATSICYIVTFLITREKAIYQICWINFLWTLCM